MKKVSIRWRLTLLVALLLSLLFLVFTLLTQRQMRSSLVEPMQAILANDSFSYQVPLEPSQPVYPANSSVPAMATTLAQGEHSFTAWLWLVMGAIVLLGGSATYVLSSLALKPITKLSNTIDALDENTLICNFDDFKAGDEVARLSSSFEALLARLRIAFAQERRFSAYAAHELKTPLSVIKTALDIMDEEDYGDKALCKETFETINKQNNRMIDLSAQLLLLSTVQRESNEQLINVATLAKEIIEELTHLAKEQGVALTYTLAEEKTLADPVMLKHALSNIVENAIRYSHKDGTVRVTLAGRVLSIVDTGIGVLPEDVPHLFEAFYRGDKSRSRSMGGTGLGLAITHEILTHHGATIHYQPNQPSGSQFIVTFGEK